MHGEGEYDAYSYSKIVSLHEKLVSGTHNLRRAQMYSFSIKKILIRSLYKVHLDKAFEVEDMVASYNDPHRYCFFAKL
jgi:hypothetical protein